MHAPLVGRILSVALLLALALPAAADPAPDRGRWSIGTSVWQLANLLPDSGHFYYLEIDHAFDERNALVLEPVTWTYHAPIGIPYGSSAQGDPAQDYPGFVRSVGLGLGWRYDLYRGLNASVRTFHFLQLYYEDDRPAQVGYQLFLQARLGWRWAPWTTGFWIEPAVAFNWWPIEAGRPASFAAKDDPWPSHFLFEPWLNLGWSW